MSCTDTPSKVQSDASLCKWNEVDLTCRLRPPPNDPIFIIIVALLAIVMSIPAISLILLVLTKYASRKPGSVVPDKETSNEDVLSENIPIHRALDRQSGIDDQSVFGTAITRGATGDQAEAFVSATEMAHFAYAGT